MIDLFILFLFNSFFIVGFHITTQEGEINNWVDKLLYRLPEWIKKPLYDCPTCMASVHSFYIYWVYIYWYCSGIWDDNGDFKTHYLLIYVVYVFGLAALNTLINAAISFFGTNIQPEK